MAEPGLSVVAPGSGEVRAPEPLTARVRPTATEHLQRAEAA